MYFLLYAHNQVVKGKEKSAIYDLQNSAIIYIPNVIVNIIEEMRTKTIIAIKKQHTPDAPEIIDKYIAFFLQKKLGFYTEEPFRFPKLDTNFYYPGIIQNAIVESNLKTFDLKKVLENLDSLGCRFLEIRLDIDTAFAFSELKHILNSTLDSIFISIDLLIKYNNLFNDEIVKDLQKSYSKIGKIIVYEAQEDKEVSNTLLFSKLSFHELELSHSQTSKYIVNIPFFCESLNFNTNYNKKIAITYNGKIKNILKDEHDYGNINKNNLITVCNSIKFQKWWHISPDKIEELKGNPLRHALFNPFPLKELTPNLYQIIII